MKTKAKLLIVLTIFFAISTSGCSSSPSAPASAAVVDELDIAIRDASDYLNDNIPEGSKIVILNIQSSSPDLSDYIIDELIANAVNDKVFTVVDRQQLDAIRAEQNFQLSGEVNDNDALAIGKFFGAQTIVSGAVSVLGDRYRLRIRALNVETAQVQGQYNRNIAAGRTINDLMRSGGGSTPVIASSGRSSSTTTGGTSSRARPSVTSVTISPDNVSVDKGKTQQFSATISGNNNPDQAVTWTVTGNLSRSTSISKSGILTVASDEYATPLTVTATSTVDTSKSGKATVAVPGGVAPLEVSNLSTWNVAVNRIRNGGNNKTYIIDITRNFSIPSVTENIFGSVTGITVFIQGSGTLSPSSNGSLLRIGAGQTVIVRDITLRGRSGNDSPVVRIVGGIFRLEGSASVRGNTSSASGSGVYVEGGTFIMQDSASVTGNTSSGSGGGVYVDGGTFIMQNDASVTSNTGI